MAAPPGTHGPTHDRTPGPAPSPAPSPTLVLSIQNRIEDLAAGMDAAEAFLAASAVGPDDHAQVMVILDEVASNIIKGAWPQGGEHSFQVELRIGPAAAARELVLLAVDDGVEFDPTAAAPPDLGLDLDEREPGGLGLFMVSMMCDGLEYRRVGAQNRLTVTKRLQEPTPP